MSRKTFCCSIVSFGLLSAALMAEPTETPHLIFEIYVQQPENGKAAMLKYEKIEISAPPLEEKNIAPAWEAAVGDVLKGVDEHYGKKAESILPSGELDVIESVSLITWSLYIDPFASWQTTKAVGSLRAASDGEEKELMREGRSLCRFYADWSPQYAENIEPVDLVTDDPSLLACLAKARNTLEKGQSARVLFIHRAEGQDRPLFAETSLHRPL
jgi:hypothetical protein